MQQSSPEKKKFLTNILYAIEYIFCLFSFTTLPIFRILAPGYAQSGLLTIIAICTLTSCGLVTRRIFKVKLTRNERKIAIILIFLLLLGGVFVDRFSYFEANKDIPLRLYYLHFDSFSKHIFLSLLFLAYPVFIAAPKKMFYPKYLANLFGVFFLANATFLPLCFTLFGNFHSGIVYFGLQDGTAGYNGYLAISDMTLFNFFIASIYFENVIVVILGFLTVVVLVLLGSRAAAVPGMVAILLAALTVCYPNIKSFVSLRFKFGGLWKFIVFSLVLTGIWGGIELIIFPQDSVLSYDNIVNSKVFSTLSGSIEEDKSLIGRVSSIQCAFNETLSSPKMLFLGGQSIPDGCSTYVHSFISCIVEFGLLGFLPLLYLIYLCVVRLFVYAKQMPLLVIMSSLFLATGLFARNNLSLFLPTLVFVYSQMSGRFEVILKTYEGQKSSLNQ